jgi:hypothetical protein
MMRTVLLALIVVVLTAMPASAAVIHAPANGATVQQDASLFFDWAWDDDEYATGNIVFTQVADPNDPIWLGGAKPGKVAISDCSGGVCGPFLASNATVTFDDARFAAGTWYWRLCNKTIYGEDDKCYVDAEVRSLTITPKPPTPACSDGIDNDLDGDTDWLEDLTCEDETGTTEGPVPQCADGADNDDDGSIDLSDDQCKHRTDRRESPDPLPWLSTAATKRYVRGALRREFGVVYRYGNFKRIDRCLRISRTRMKCRPVSWSIGDVGWRGGVTIWYRNDSNGDVSWLYALTIKRTNEYCVVRKRAGDPAYRSKRCMRIHRARSRG